MVRDRSEQAHVQTGPLHKGLKALDVAVVQDWAFPDHVSDMDLPMTAGATFHDIHTFTHVRTSTTAGTDEALCCRW